MLSNINQCEKSFGEKWYQSVVVTHEFRTGHRAFPSQRLVTGKTCWSCLTLPRLPHLPYRPHHPRVSIRCSCPQIFNSLNELRVHRHLLIVHIQKGISNSVSAFKGEWLDGFYITVWLAEHSQSFVHRSFFCCIPCDFSISVVHFVIVKTKMFSIWNMQQVCFW